MCGRHLCGRMAHESCAVAHERCAVAINGMKAVRSLVSWRLRPVFHCVLLVIEVVHTRFLHCAYVVLCNQSSWCLCGAQGVHLLPITVPMRCSPSSVGTYAVPAQCSISAFALLTIELVPWRCLAN